jgi:glycosyltransferase involved in cell wall biosynthesis
MKISIVIPTANRHDKILRAIDKIYENTILPHEVIVVDQSQDDATDNILARSIEQGKVTYIKDEGTGISRSKNIGWKYASGEIVAFTDDDAWVESTWLENIKSSFLNQQFKIGVLGGKIIPVYEEKNSNWNFPERWSYLLPASDLGDSLGTYEGDSTPPGVNFSIHRSLLENFSGFDERLGVDNGKSIQIFGEDNDLCCRIKKAGYDLVYNPSCIVYHPVPLSRQSQDFLDKRLIQEGMTYAYFQIKNAELKTWECCISLVKSLLKYMYLKLIKPNNDYAQYLQGKMIALLRFGILKMQLQ